MSYQRLRGTHDIYGDDALCFQKIESTAREVFKNFGFSEIRTPILEEKEVFTRALGTETDVVQKEMYEFEDRSKTQVAMRPEGTAGVVRAYLENNFDKTEGLTKLFYIGPMFRSERPQAGRLRQFHQIGVEALGTSSPYADAEAIHCLTTFLDRAGAGGYKVKINNLGTFDDRGHFKETLKKWLEPHMNSLCEDCKKRITKNVFRVLDCKVESCHAIIKLGPRIENFLSSESIEYFSKVQKALSSLEIKYEQDSFMVRGLDYYTKTVFEITHPKLGAQDALAAGGRYDNLIQAFGGNPAGAVGFAIGIERLIMCLSDDAKKPESKKSYFIVTLGERAFLEGFKLLSKLRSQGILVDMDFNGKSMNSQMRSANKSGSRYAIILGDNELDKGVLMLKDMKDSSQKEVDLKNLETALNA